jgi:hypothetical protein
MPAQHTLVKDAGKHLVQIAVQGISTAEHISNLALPSHPAIIRDENVRILHEDPSYADMLGRRLVQHIFRVLGHRCIHSPDSFARVHLRLHRRNLIEIVNAKQDKRHECDNSRYMT